MERKEIYNKVVVSGTLLEAENEIARKAPRNINKNKYDQNYGRILGLPGLPIIPKGTLAEIILKDAHKETLCGTDAEVASNIAWRYEILYKTGIIKKIRNTCVTCSHYKGVKEAQKMGNIPDFFKDRKGLEPTTASCLVINATEEGYQSYIERFNSVKRAVRVTA